MIRFLQFIFIFSFLFAQLNMFAQNDRVKISKTAQEPEMKQAVSNNQRTVKLTSEKNQEFKTNQQQFKFRDSASIDGFSDKGAEKKTANPSDEKIFFSDNVTYYKEIIPQNEQIVLSEKKSKKVEPSVNYKPRVVKEDIHPVLNYSSTDISSEKRVYLQQEADDLMREMDLNAGNADYDLASKKKKLDDIKKMLQ